MSELVEWLTAILDEHERVARAADEKALSPWRNSNGLVKHSGPPEGGHGRDNGLWDDEGTSGMKVDHQLCMLGEIAEHVALHDPAAVLALIQAQRQILAAHAPTRYTNADLGIKDAPVCLTCHAVMDSPEDWPDEADWSYPLVQRSFPCPTVRALASAYRHAPGWDEAWGST